MIGRWLFLAFVVTLALLLAFVIIPADQRAYDRCVADLVTIQQDGQYVDRYVAEMACR